MTVPVEDRLEPFTQTLHLDFNAGEPALIELEVIARNGNPVPLDAAWFTVGQPGCAAPLVEWASGADTELVVADQDRYPGVVRLRVTGGDTAEWSRAWGDADWQLDVVDIFARERRPCSGHVRVWSGLRDGEGGDLCRDL